MSRIGSRIVRDASLSYLLGKLSNLAVNRLKIANDIAFVTLALRFDFAVFLASLMTAFKAL